MGVPPKIARRDAGRSTRDACAPVPATITVAPARFARFQNNLKKTSVDNAANRAPYSPPMKYRVTLIEEPEGGWSVKCDDLRGCYSQGETREEAIANIRVAITEYLEAMDEVMKRENGTRAVIREEVLV